MGICAEIHPELIFLMRLLAELLDRLALNPSRLVKLALLQHYFRQAPAREAGWTLALLTGTLKVPSLQASTLRKLVKTRVDPILYDLSYSEVGDQAETIALIWPTRPDFLSGHNSASTPTSLAAASGGTLSQVVETLQKSNPAEALTFAETFLDEHDPITRWTFIKLVTGATLRIGVSARLAKTALAEVYGMDVDDLEKVWSAFDPPYAELFDWLQTGGRGPVVTHEVFYHPVLLAHPLNESDLSSMEPADYAAEWKWDGIRVQIASDGHQRRRLFSRSGEDITESFPELPERCSFQGVLDGELLILSQTPASATAPGAFPDIAPFADLQKRLNRKRPTPRLLDQFPALVCLYDALFLDGCDLRSLPWEERRACLEKWAADQKFHPDHFRVSPLIAFSSWEDLRLLCAEARAHHLEGLMLKKKNSPYTSGRPKGLWYKWKRKTLNLDAVLMYAQRGHGKRSSFYSDYTFGVWRSGPDGQLELVPVGKAYSGFTDEELVRLDQWIRRHTTQRFGSVRAVAPELVLEVEFDALQRSSRHKSGVAMRFPRLQRIRWDKPASEAATLDQVLGLLPSGR